MLGFMAAIAMAAGDTPYAAMPNWHVYRNEGTCSLITGKNVEDQVIALILTYDAKLKDVKVYFNDPSVKSLKEGQSKKLDLALARGGKLDNGWSDKDYTVGIGKDGQANFSTVLDDQILDDIASSDVVGFYFGKVILQAFPLRGSVAAIGKLRECARDESAKHPSDPFG